MYIVYCIQLLLNNSYKREFSQKMWPTVHGLDIEKMYLKRDYNEMAKFAMSHAWPGLPASWMMFSHDPKRLGG